jgi:arginase
MTRGMTRVIAVPFHDGRLEFDRGRGPGELLAAAGIEDAETIPPPDPVAPEAARVFAIAAELAGRVRAARAAGAAPVVVAGDCDSCLGTVGGCGTEGLGVVWFDAHADFDTPHDSLSGSLDAMGLAVLTGHGWDALRATVPGLAPIDEEDVVLLAVRDLEPYQRERLARSRLRVVGGGAAEPFEGRVEPALDGLRERVSRVYLHVDLDALDPGEGIANRYAAPGGLTLDQLLWGISLVADRFEIAAAAITAYEPAADADGRMLRAATRVLDAVSEATRRA